MPVALAHRAHPLRHLLNLHAATALVVATVALMVAPQPALSADLGMDGTTEEIVDARVEPTSFIRPLKGERSYRLLVIGDSVGANLADGLKWTFRRKEGVIVRKRTKAGTGFVRTDVYDWQRAIKRLCRRGTDIVVILIGGNDRQDMRVRGRRYERFSAKWRAEYVKRLEKAARTLRGSGAAVYWVGLPNVRSKQMSRDYIAFNRQFKRVSKRYGFRYIDIRDLFVTRSGGYSDYGKDLRGRRVRLRDRDGIHMSNAGSRLLGQSIATHIRNDLPQNVTASAANERRTKYVRKRVAQQ